MNGMGLIQLSSPQLSTLLSQVQALSNTVGQESTALDTLSTEHNQLALQVATLTPDNVIESNEFTGAAILELLKAVDGLGSGLDADLLGGVDLTALRAEMAASGGGVELGPEQLTGAYQYERQALGAVPSNSVIVGAKTQTISLTPYTVVKYRTIL